MSYYHLKQARIKKNGELSVTVADSSTFPKTYFTSKYEGTHAPTILQSFLVSLQKGYLQPTPSCSLNGLNLRDVLNAMEDLKKPTRNVSFSDDWKMGTDTHDTLCRLVAKIAEPWLKAGEITVTDENKKEILEYDIEAGKMIEAKRKEAKDNGTIFVSAALVSNLFDGYDALIDEDENMFLGVRSAYDNKCHYDNSGSTAIYLSEDEDEDTAYTLFEFFGNAFATSHMAEVEVPWDRLIDIPGSNIAEKLWDVMRN